MNFFQKEYKNKRDTFVSLFRPQVLQAKVQLQITNVYMNKIITKEKKKIDADITTIKNKVVCRKFDLIPVQFPQENLFIRNLKKYFSNEARKKICLK